MPRFFVFLCCLVLSAFSLAPQSSRAASADASPTTGPAGTDSPDRQGEVQMETGLALPLGDLGAGFPHTERGLGAGPGYNLGLRVRFYPARGIMAAPSFTYVEFGAHEGLQSGGEPFAVRATALRYGLDLLYLAPGDARSIRPFVGIGLALVRNKYREEFPEAKTEFLAAANSLAGSLVCGVRRGDWNVSFVYEANRFTTSLLSFDGEPRRHRWNSLLLRVGFTLPRI